MKLSTTEFSPLVPAGVRERVLEIPCQGQVLPGILSLPDASVPAPDSASEQVGVLVIVGGPQYRAGSHRQFTLLARALAGRGHACLRFDVRGMGDAPGEPRDFEQLDEDIGAALDAWQELPGAPRRVVLWGLCDGASAALLYLHGRPDARVAGLCLLNPWVRTEQGLVQTQLRHYYWERLRQPAFWKKLLSGRVGLAAAREWWGKLSQSRQSKAQGGPGGASTTCLADAHYTDRMLAAWMAFPQPILLLLSGDDYVAKEFLDRCQQHPGWAAALQHPGLQRVDLPHANHTFSSAAWRAEVEGLCGDFLQRLRPASQGATS